MANHWEISVINPPAKNETVVLPGDFPREDVKTVMRLILARQLTPDEIRQCFYVRSGNKSEHLDIDGSETELRGTLGSPAVYARLVEAPKNKH